jgi:UDP-2,3-diacylglucosamine hydrolase
VSASIAATPIPASAALAPGTLVICDLHLDLGAREGGLAVAAWLDALRDVPLLVVLGDLFDVWVGPAQATLPGAGPVLGALKRLTARGTRVRVVPGNRDFLLGERFERESGAELAAHGLVLAAPGGGTPRVLLVHGDELCTLDAGYQRLRAVVRSRPVAWLAPRMPLPLALHLARRLRRASTRAVAQKPLEHKSMQPPSADALARACSADVLVCGHAHAYVERALDGGARWIVLDAFGGARDLLRVERDGSVAVGSSGVGAEPATGPMTEPVPEPDSLR